MLDEISRTVCDEAMYCGGGLKGRQQCMSAVKEGLNPLLDVARQTYDEVTQDVHDIIKSYQGTSMKYHFVF
jgi:hypothetical protein